MGGARFDVDGWIERCRTAAREAEPERAVEALMLEAMGDRGELRRALGEREHAGLVTLYRGEDLTVLDFAWAPWMCFKPHDHTMWSVVGLLFGREDNVFWRRSSTRTRTRTRTRTIEAAGARSIGEGEVVRLDADVIHSVTNPIGKFTRAVHVYGGDFFAPRRARSEWDPETLAERPWDLDDTRRLFHDAELRAARPTSGVGIGPPPAPR